MALDGYTDETLSRQARAVPLLDAATEVALAVAWRDRHDSAALHRLVMAHMRLAIATAARFRRYGAPMNDLIQEASVGLMKAAERFDPDRGVRFSTYALWWIKASIQDYVMRNWSLVRTGSTSAQKALFFNLRRVQAQMAREAGALGETLDAHQLRERVALEIGVTLAEVEMMEGRLAGMDASLNAPQAADDEGREWIEALEDPAPQAAEAIEVAHDRAALRGWLAQAMSGLTARERFIVAERRLREEPRTLESLGAELGLSKERIRQLEAAAHAKLRKALTTISPEVQAFLV